MYDWAMDNWFYYHNCSYFYEWYDSWNQTHNDNFTDNCTWDYEPVCYDSDCSYTYDDLDSCEVTECWNECTYE
jgi:hypothetical protein